MTYLKVATTLLVDPLKEHRVQTLEPWSVTKVNITIAEEYQCNES